MTTKEYILKLRHKADFINKKVFVGIAASDVNSDVSIRIFEKGLNSDNEDIGTYQGGDLYVNPNKSRKKFPKKGKNGDATFKNGEPHKTGYFESYASYRTSQNRQNKSVDLKLTGLLFQDFATGLTQTEEGSWSTILKNEKNVDKKNGAENKYGNVFGLTKQEIEKFNKICTFEILKALKK